jgi:hypothetical protein
MVSDLAMLVVASDTSDLHYILAKPTPLKIECPSMVWLIFDV